MHQRPKLSNNVFAFMQILHFPFDLERKDDVGWLVDYTTTSCSIRPTWCISNFLELINLVLVVWGAVNLVCMYDDDICH